MAPTVSFSPRGGSGPRGGRGRGGGGRGTPRGGGGRGRGGGGRGTPRGGGGRGRGGGRGFSPRGGGGGFSPKFNSEDSPMGRGGGMSNGRGRGGAKFNSQPNTPNTNGELKLKQKMDTPRPAPVSDLSMDDIETSPVHQQQIKQSEVKKEQHKQSEVKKEQHKQSEVKKEQQKPQKKEKPQQAKPTPAATGEGDLHSSSDRQARSVRLTFPNGQLKSVEQVKKVAPTAVSVKFPNVVFVEFSTESETDRMREQLQTMVDDNQLIQVSFLGEKERLYQSTRRTLDHTKLFVRGIGTATETDVRRLFPTCTAVAIRGRAQQGARGHSYCFVTFAGEAACTDALEKSKGLTLFGNALIVNYAFSKDNSAAQKRSADDAATVTNGKTKGKNAETAAPVAKKAKKLVDEVEDDDDDDVEGEEDDDEDDEEGDDDDDEDAEDDDDDEGVEGAEADGDDDDDDDEDDDDEDDDDDDE